MTCIIVIVYVTLTLPYHITWQIGTYGNAHPLAKTFSVLFLTATSASHPIIYSTFHRELAREFKTILCGCKKKKAREIPPGKLVALMYRSGGETSSRDKVFNRTIKSRKDIST